MWVEQVVMFKKAGLAKLLAEPMAAVAARCEPVWTDAERLDAVLADAIGTIPHCHLLYALDTEGRQLSSNISATGSDPRFRGQTLAERPFTGNLPYKGFLLSAVYLSKITRRRCLTAVQAVGGEGKLLGFIAADFNLDDIPFQPVPPQPTSQWTQYKGDPAIRQTVFDQKRMKSSLDARADEVIGTIDTLMREHGVYHFILHFSSSRAIFWVHDDPYRYRFHGVDEILHPEIWLAYPPQDYPTDAVVAAEEIRAVLEQFRVLREGDENIYLRSGSLNIMNGIIGLTFSCDGSHYLTVDDFLNKAHPFWI